MTPAIPHLDGLNSLPMFSLVVLLSVGVLAETGELYRIRSARPAARLRNQFFSQVKPKHVPR
jgi:hypothetical protein